MDNVLKDFLRTTRSMESNIVAIISDSNRDIEMILKELLIYLDATSKNLEKVQGSLVQFVDDYDGGGDGTDLNDKIGTLRTDISAVIKAYTEKMLVLESGNTKKILELVRQVGVSNNKMIKNLTNIVTKVSNDIDLYGTTTEATSNDMQEIKNLLRIITNEVKDTKVNVSKNQDNLMTVIGNIMDADNKKIVSTNGVEAQRIKSDEEKFKAKLKLWGKIVGIVLGSGGVLYLIVDVMIKAGS